MKFSYSNRQLIVNLIMGIVWIGLGIRAIYTREINESIGYKPYVFIGVGILFLIYFYYQYSKKYFEVTDEWIKVNSFLDKKIYVDDLTKIHFKSGIYVFVSKDKRFKIMQPKIKRSQINAFNEWFDKVKKKVDKKRGKEV